MMKNIVYILALFFTIPSFSQNMERWDSKTGVYSNFEWGFSWTLPNEITWEKGSGMERHTVFRAESSDALLTVFVNINPPGGNVKLNEDGLWDKFESLKNQIIQVENNIPNTVGGKVIESNFEKVKFADKKAIKHTYITRYEDDDRYKNESFDAYAVTYMVIHKNATWSISFKLDKEILDYAGEDIIYEVFRGFHFIASDSDSEAFKDMATKAKELEYFYNALKSRISKMNESLPMEMLDGVTIQKCSFADNSIIYDYILDDVFLDDDIIKGFKDATVQNLKSSSPANILQYIKEANISIKQRFYNNKGVLKKTIIVTSKEL